jgi:Trk-type K+ transport system membrane component
MNLTKLGKSTWIIILNLVLVIILIGLLMLKSREYFTNYPQQVNPLAAPESSPESAAASAANNNYAALLMYIKNNPSNSIKFIQDIKQKFFDSTCNVKNTIDFKNVAQMPNGVLF